MTNVCYGFVSGPSTVSDNESYFTIGTQIERGKIEPNENKSSYQDAQIDIYKIKYTKGFAGNSLFSRYNIYTEYGIFSSGEEKVASDSFYQSDNGNYVTLGIYGDIFHDLEKQFGIYLQVTPFRNYNEDKFSNPRLDLFSFGIASAHHVTENFFNTNLIHFGSGESSKQNSYFAVNTGYGYKLNELLGRQFTITGSLFFEADSTKRFDASYDSVFSPTGKQDRVQSFKYGTLIAIDFSVSQNFNLSLNSLQKLAGYDARATQIYTATLGYKYQ